MKNKVLILSPHTDDAEIGAGGFISKLIEEKKDILWVVFSSARESIPEGIPNDTLYKEFLNVMHHLKIDKNHFIVFDYTVRRLNEKRQDILESLVEIRNKFKPQLVLGPSLNDIHQDHQIVANEMIRAFKSSSSILCYELPWNHLKFENQFFVKLEEEHIQKKIKLLSFYKSQILKNRNYFSKDFIKGLSITRGVQVNTNYAEAFEVLRWIID